MFSIRVNKIFRDLWKNRARTLLTILAVTVGIIGVGTVLSAYSILVRELDANYMVTDPASASVYLDRLDEQLVEDVRNLPEIKEVEARGFYQARFEIGQDEWATMSLFVVNDFEHLRLNKFTLEDGARPPQKGEILLERVAFGVAQAKIGDTRYVVIPGNQKVKLHITGSIHDPGEAPAWMENMVYGYITPETLEMLGKPYLNELNITVAENYFDREHVQNVVHQLKATMEEREYTVIRSNVPVPGKHPHATMLSALLFLLQVFGGLTLILSSIIVVNLISAMLAQEIRQIGVMKALGGRTSQIMEIYIGKVSVLGIIALIIAIPSAVFFSRQYSVFSAKMLNFTIMDDTISPLIFVIIICMGLLIPILSALYPVYKGSRITVREAMNDYGISQGSFKINHFYTMFTKMKMSRPMLFSIRNTFRKHGRVMLTLATLAVGGAMFLASLNIGASITKTIEVIGETLRYDIEISLASPAPQNTINDIIANTHGASDFEGWGETRGMIVHPDETTGEFFPVIAPLSKTKLFSPPVVAGTWLKPEEKNGVVVTHLVKALEPDIQVGEEIVLRIGTTDVTWNVMGIVQQIGPPVAYVNYEYLAEITHQQGMAKNVRIVAQEKDEESQQLLMQRLEQNFEQAGIALATQSNVGEYRKALEDHFLIIVSFLLAMSALMVIVGGLGLMTTMSIQVIERTREIGVMRAIGASSHTLMRIINLEGLSIGMISWIIAGVIAVPVSYYVGNIFGNIFFRAPLNFAIEPLSMLVWLGIIIVFSLIASMLPASRAIRLTVRDTLTYE